MRKPFNFRLSEVGHQWLAETAEQHGVTQADVMRACLMLAQQNPKFLASALGRKL